MSCAQATLHSQIHKFTPLKNCPEIQYLKFYQYRITNIHSKFFCLDDDQAFERGQFSQGQYRNRLDLSNEAVTHFICRTVQEFTCKARKVWFYLTLSDTFSFIAAISQWAVTFRNQYARSCTKRVVSGRWKENYVIAYIYITYFMEIHNKKWYSCSTKLIYLP
jgi:hypothetical protein